MGFFSKMIVGAYRYIRYGKQLGKTAKNGTKVYKRAGKTTAIDNSGNIKRTTQKKRFNKYTSETTAIDYLPFDQQRVGVSRVTRDGNTFSSGINWRKEPYKTEQYNDWHVDNNGNINVRKW